jgi:hypothetical protein
MDAIDGTRSVAERVLAERGATVRLGDGVVIDSSSRSLVLRCSVEDGPATWPSTLVVKRSLDIGADWDVPDQPGGGPTTRFLNEWASLHYLGDLAQDAPVAPRLVGADRDAGVLVMEDLGPVKTLAAVLNDDDPHAARDALIAYASMAGRMQACSTPQLQAYRQLRSALGPTDPGFGTGWIMPTVHVTLESLGIAPPAGIDAELAHLEGCLADPGAFSVLIHSDPCPGNWAITRDGGRLLDFEYSRVGHALLDGVYARMPFPTCWNAGRLPDDTIAAMEAAYRSELMVGCEAAADDRQYANATAEACAVWLVLLLHWHPLSALLEDDREWGTVTGRQRLLARCDVVDQATSSAHHLEELGRVASEMAHILRNRWSGTLEAIPLYPAFLDD